MPEDLDWWGEDSGPFSLRRGVKGDFTIGCHLSPQSTAASFGLIQRLNLASARSEYDQDDPEGAHGIRNETDRTVRVLKFSTVVHPIATGYPDSDKVGVWTGDPEADVIVRRESKVDYFDGET